MKTAMTGKIRISRYTGGERGSGITISVTDDQSGCEFIEIELTAEVLGNALTGMSFLPCEFELRAQNVGKTRELKTLVIPFECESYALQNEEARAALAPYEVDGWMGHDSDILNHHNRTDKGQRVNFIRFV